MTSDPKTDQHENEFQKAGRQERMSLAQEFLVFIKEEKMWWMVPIVLALGCLAFAAAFSSTGAAPFIYTLF